MNNIFKDKVPFVIICLAFILFNILFFLFVPFDTATTGLWLAYAFLDLAFIIAGTLALTIRLKSKTTMTIIGPLTYATGAYLGVSLLANLIMIFVNGENFRPVVVINVIILFFYAVVFLIAYKSFGRVEDNTVKREADTAKWRQASIKVNSLAFLSQDAEVIKAVKQLKNNLDYSSPNSTQTTQEYEQQFLDQVDTISSLINTGASQEAVLKAVKTAENLLKVRNQMLLIK